MIINIFIFYFVLHSLSYNFFSLSLIFFLFSLKIIISIISFSLFLFFLLFFLESTSSKSSILIFLRFYFFRSSFITRFLENVEFLVVREFLEVIIEKLRRSRIEKPKANKGVSLKNCARYLLSFSKTYL